MKTTIEIDESKLERLMRLTGLKTRKEVVDWALTEAERIATVNRIGESPWDAEFLRDAVDPDYKIRGLLKGMVWSESEVREENDRSGRRMPISKTCRT